VITVAAGFPTTVAPIVQYGAVPVFVDITLPSYNVDTDALEPARSARTGRSCWRTRSDNPFDTAGVRDFCDRHGLWLIEDNCDALGSRVLHRGSWRLTGTVGHLGTASFYPPHHLTMAKAGPSSPTTPCCGASSSPSATGAATAGAPREGRHVRPPLRAAVR